MKLVSATVFSIGLMFAGTALAMDGDVDAGKKVFKKCKACHIVEEAKNKVGPSLKNVIGRQPGTVEDFKYSKAMKAFGEGKIWDEALLTEYLAKPRKVVKGTKMAFPGLKKDKDIVNIIAFLKTFSEEMPSDGGDAEATESTEETQQTN